MALSVLIILLPLLSALGLLLFRPPPSATALYGSLGIGLSAAISFFLCGEGLITGIKSHRDLLWQVLPTGIIDSFSLEFALLVDPISLTMCMVVSFVSLWIAIYSAEYMANETGFLKFFVLINLFVAFMLLLVLADTLWLLFMGWEGVGVCSYLLIGFYYREQRALRAALQAFMVTRIGDIFLLIGMIITALFFKTLDLKEINQQAELLYPEGSFIITIIALCLLLGAVGKSAQLPLHTWLADAMWGPTPVSALIHAATMVTAGVYLVARMAGLFALSHFAEGAVVIIGIATLLVAGMLAIFQSDLKRVLAYSTMSQIGYMFLALGVKAPAAALFHLATHAFFKALLFLAAGIIGHSLGTYQLNKMGGLKNSMPNIFWLFSIGAISLMGLPFISAGFFSKEWILHEALHAPGFGYLAYAAGALGAGLTGIYVTRMLLLVFFGEGKPVHAHASMRMLLPLYVLAFFSFALGFLEIPKALASQALVSTYLGQVSSAKDSGLIWLFIPSLCCVLGILIALSLRAKLRFDFAQSPIMTIITEAFGFAFLYEKLIVKPYLAITKLLTNQIIDQLMASVILVLRRAIFLVNKIHHLSLAHYLSFLVMSVVLLASVMVRS